MPTPTTLNEALAEIEVLNTQIQYLTEQAAIASAITNKVIPDNSTAINGVATAITNKVIPDYSDQLDDIVTHVEAIAENTEVSVDTAADPPAMPIVNTAYVSQK